MTRNSLSVLLAATAVCCSPAVFGQGSGAGARAIALGGNGIYLGGGAPPVLNKTSVDGVTIWSVELSSDPNATVLALGVAGDGSVYAAGVQSKGGFLAHISEAGATLSFLALPTAARTLALDALGAVYIGGDGFIRKLNAYQTPVTGRVTGLAVDSGGSAYAAIADTRGRVAKLAPEGDQWLWSADLGAAAPAAVALDGAGAVYVTGTTQSLDFVTKNAAQDRMDGPSDAFVAKVLPAGELAWSTYLGGRGPDGGTSIGFDVDGTLLVGGYTASPDFPASDLWQGGEDGFLAWLDSNNGNVTRSMYLGSPGQDRVNGLTIGRDGWIHVAGLSNDTGTLVKSFGPHKNAAPVQPAACSSSISVANTADSGAGSLRQALLDVCPGGTISLAGLAGQTITLSPTATTYNYSGRLLLNQDVSIVGPTSGTVIISGNNMTRIFFLKPGVTASISNVTLANGFGKGGDSGHGGGAAGMGGAIFQNGGTLNLTNVILSGNSAQGGGYSPAVKYNLGGGGFGGDATTDAGASGGDLGGAGGSAAQPPNSGAGSGGDGAGGGGGYEADDPDTGVVTILLYPGPGGFGGGGGAGTFHSAGADGGFGAGQGNAGNPRSGWGAQNEHGAGFGGAIFVRSGTLNLNSVTFTNNSALQQTSLGSNPGQGKGGALFIYSGATVTTSGSNIFSGNVAPDAGKPGVGYSSPAPYTHGALCPGVDTVDVCGQISSSLVFSAVGSTHVNQVVPAFTVKILDGFGNVAIGANSLITLTTTASFAPSATTTVQAVNGVATFSNVIFATGGLGVKMTATLASSPLQATSNGFAVFGNGTQTITFAPVPDTLFSTGALTLAASASSGLPVSLVSSTPSTCSVSGAQVKLLAIGKCTIDASQGGDGNYSPATDVIQSFNITLSSQTITFSPLFDTALNGGPVSLVGEATSSSGLPVTFSSQTPAICTVSGTTVTLVAIGKCTIAADQAGNTSYAPAPTATQSFNVTLNTQTITFPSPGSVALNAGPVTMTATASSGLPVSYSSLTTSICTVSGSSVTLVAVGTCNIQATQAGNATYAAATPATQTLYITANPQTITFAQPPDTALNAGPVTLTATASSDLAVSFASLSTSICTVSGSSVTLVAGGNCTIQATQGGNTTYLIAPSVSRTFKVLAIGQTITFPQPADTALNAGPLTLTATASSGSPVSYSSSTASTCSVSGSAVTLIAAGACTIQASQAGNASYNAATPVSKTFNILTLPQSITFPQPADVSLNAGPVTLTATASSGLPVTYSSSTASTCLVSGSAVTLIAAGACTIQATQAGNASYNAATPVSKTFNILALPQTITFPQPADVSLNAGPVTLTATASSGLPVTYSGSTASTCSVSGSAVTLIAAGACTIQASQAGNSTYSAAVPVSRTFAILPTNLTSIDYPGATNTTLWGINHFGQISGTYTLPNGTTHSFVYSNGQFTAVPDYFQSTSTILRGLNDNGLLAGDFVSPSGNGSVIYNLTTGVYTLKTIANSASTSFYGVDNLGDTVGAYTATWGTKYGFTGFGNDIQPVSFPNATATYLFGINGTPNVNTARAVGQYTDGSGNSHGFLSVIGGFMGIDYPGSTNSAATAIYAATTNSSINVIGNYKSPGNAIVHGFLLQGLATYSTVDYPGTGVTATNPNGINDAGVIVGSYADATGNHGFIKTP